LSMPSTSSSAVSVARAIQVWGLEKSSIMSNPPGRPKGLTGPLGGQRTK
jgi:hypothetical protein